MFAKALEHYLRSVEPFDHIHLMRFQHGTCGPGLASGEHWRELLAYARQRGGEFLGVKPEKHPQDFAALARDHTSPRKVPARYPMPPPLSWSQLEHFLEESGDKYPVRWEESVTPLRPAGRPPVEEGDGPWEHAPSPGGEPGG